METKEVKKIGNSCFVILDKKTKAISGIDEGDAVEVTARKNKVIIQKLEDK